MAGITIAAALTTLFTITVTGLLISQVSKPADYRLLVIVFLIGLPLSLTTFYGARMPLRPAVQRLFEDAPQALTLYQLVEAPLFEEPAKLVPLFVVTVLLRRKLVTERNRVPLAMSLGLGFGVGEIWLVAEFIQNNPQLRDLPFYQFGGFIAERLLVSVVHGGFTLASVLAIERGVRWLPLGLFISMTLHFVGNLPAFLASMNLGLPADAVSVLALLWVIVLYALTLAAVVAIHFGWSQFKLILRGKRVCPYCRESFSRQWLALNLGFRSYERCPHCRRWHLVDLRENLPDEAA